MEHAQWLDHLHVRLAQEQGVFCNYTRSSQDFILNFRLFAKMPNALRFPLKKKKLNNLCCFYGR